VKSSSNAVSKGEVLDQVMPEVSQKARATIRGTVRSTVKVRVDASGNVTGAELSSAGPSRYFADLALQAARRWDFAPAKLDGHAVPSEWLVRFEFTPSKTKAVPTQATP
jgi:TonB family protein